MNFYNNLKNFKNNTALVINGKEKITYEDLIFEAEKFVSNIAEERSLIFILIDNDLESIVALIGSELNNSVIMLINPNINISALNKLINLYKPDYIFLSKEKNMETNDFELIFSYGVYELLKSIKFFSKKINKKLLFLQTTSGSTGSPKNVKLSYENLKSNTDSIINDLKISKNDIAITTLPPSYVYGLSIINTHLKVGAKIVLNKFSVLEKKFWNMLVFNKVNNFGAVPYIYEILIKIGLKEEFFKNLKYTTVAGGHLDNNLKLSLLKFYEKVGVKLITMYGAAEATSRMSILSPKYSQKKIGSIGVPISNGKIYIEDENKKIITKPYQRGELIFEGKNVFMGYANSFYDLYKQEENNYILKTGDIGYFDKDHFFYIVGKKNRYIKIIGNRISLDELQKIIYEFGYKNVCCQNLKDTLDIFINVENVEDKIQSYVAKYLSLNKSLIKINYLKSFPMTKNNKIDYNNIIFKK
jgi:long-chain acyl-CoA synthetase